MCILCQELGAPFLKESSPKGRGDEEEEMVLSQRAPQPGQGRQISQWAQSPPGQGQVWRPWPLSHSDGGKALDEGTRARSPSPAGPPLPPVLRTTP